MSKIPRKFEPFAEKLSKDDRRKIRRRNTWRFIVPLVVLMFAGFTVASLVAFWNGRYLELLLEITFVCLGTLCLWWLWKIEDHRPRVE
ncbi:MAG: hypothetical protein FWC50_06930 [Planctomycetaceae bacterium]|nr:hypothetical protein [Planctomycetaceae bacterium]